MMNHHRSGKKSLIFRIVTLAALVAVGLVPLSGDADAKPPKPDKVQLCHVTGNGGYVVIEVSQHAVHAHSNHGDLIVGVDVDENCQPLITDSDGDGVADDQDNCVDAANPDQADTYGSSAGDACEDLDGDGTPDADEADFCLSIDGVDVINRGTAVCATSVSTTSEPNVAVANGINASAAAGTGGPFGAPILDQGSNAFASAIGDYALAIASGLSQFGYEGDNVRAIAEGTGAYAVVAPGNNTTATSIGNGARTQANYARQSSATALGTNADAAAGNGTNNHGVADGDNARGWARLGNDNSATATGAGASAEAQWGNNNTATSSGPYACAGGTGPLDRQDGETAVDVNLC